MDDAKGTIGLDLEELAGRENTPELRAEVRAKLEYFLRALTASEVDRIKIVPVPEACDEERGIFTFDITVPVIYPVELDPED